MDEKIKFGIYISEEYENKTKIKDTLFDLKNKFGDQLEISCINTNRNERFLRKKVLDSGILYKEFNPAHTIYNMYSALRESSYEKQYAFRNYFVAAKILASYVDYMLLFGKKNEINDIFEYLYTKVKERNIKFQVIS